MPDICKAVQEYAYSFGLPVPGYISPGAPAYLVIFDRRPETKLKPWEKRITRTTEGTVRVAGC
jgi:hypothetical protein